MDNNDQEAVYVGDIMLGLDVTLTLHVNKPMKRALRAVAAMKHISVADIVRQAVDEYCRSKYPEYKQYYNRFVLEEMKSMGMSVNTISEFDN